MPYIATSQACSEISRFDSISSEPVRVCFCNEDRQPHTVTTTHSQTIYIAICCCRSSQQYSSRSNHVTGSYLSGGGLGENQLLQSTEVLKFSQWQHGSEQLFCMQMDYARMPHSHKSRTWLIHILWLSNSCSQQLPSLALVGIRRERPTIEAENAPRNSGKKKASNQR